MLEITYRVLLAGAVFGAACADVGVVAYISAELLNRVSLNKVGKDMMASGSMLMLACILLRMVL